MCCCVGFCKTQRGVGFYIIILHVVLSWLTTPVQRVAPLFETIYFPPLSVVLSTPDDQDFDIETTVAEEPGWVFDVLVTKTKEGREEEFQELRKLVQKRMFNSRDVEQFYTFTVNRDIVSDERAALKVRR